MSKLFYLALLLIACCALPTASAQWNQTEADIFLRLSWAAYCPAGAIANWNCYWCTYSGSPHITITDVVTHSPTGTLGYIGFYTNTIVVIFRGTTNLANILTDLKFGKTSPFPEAPGAAVHTGFLQAWQGVASLTKSAIQRAQARCGQCKRVVFGGHSLGAAITTLASVEVAKSGITKLPISSLTLGSPRVGNQAFVDYVTSVVPNVIRWTNSADVVPHLPPKALNFRHRVREVWETKVVNYKQCSATNGEDPTCANSVLLPISTKDHSAYGGLPLHSGTCETFSGNLEAIDIDEELLWAVKN